MTLNLTHLNSVKKMKCVVSTTSKPALEMCSENVGKQLNNTQEWNEGSFKTETKGSNLKSDLKNWSL